VEIMTEDSKLVRVTTYQIEDPDTVDDERIINYANASDRTWLGKHSWWAFSNSRGIELEPVTAR
jgi:hypothetical protein